jgi:hypothetical protein
MHRSQGVVLFIGHFRIDQRTACIRWPDAMPTSRSAAVRRGFAARARCSAVWSDNVWEYDTPVSQGLTSSADAHAIRVATLLIDMKIGTRRAAERRSRARRMHSGQEFGGGVSSSGTRSRRQTCGYAKEEIRGSTVADISGGADIDTGKHP